MGRDCFNSTPPDCIDLPTCTFANILLGMSWSSAGVALDLTNHFLLWKSLKALKGVQPNTIKCHLICTKKDSNERDQWCSYQLYWGHNICELLQKSGKGQIYQWSSQTSSRISQLVGRLVVTMLKTALFQTISTWHPNTFCPCCPILTQYHQVLNNTAP